jgi:hypothetical protein
VGVHVFPDQEVSEASGKDTKGQWDSSRKEDSYETESEREWCLKYDRRCDKQFTKK